MVIGGITGPIFGNLSDNTKTKYGRRTPWILISLPFVALGFWLLCIPYPIRFFINNAMSVTVYTIILYIIYSIVFNAMNVPYVGLMPEITGAEERTQMSFYYNMIGTIGTVSIFFVPSLLLGIYNSYAFVTGVYALILVGLMLIGLFYVKEHKNVDVQEFQKEKMSLKDVFKNKEFIKFEIAQVCWNFAFMIILSSIISFATTLLGLQDESELMPFMLFLILTVGPSVAFWLTQSDKIGKKKSLVFALIWMGSIFPFTILLGFLHFNGIPLVIPFFILIGFIAFGLPVILLMPYSILMDLTEEGKEASYMGSNSIFLNFSGSLGTLLLSILSVIFFNQEITIFFIIGPVLGAFLFLAAFIAHKIKIK